MGEKKKSYSENKLFAFKGYQTEQVWERDRTENQTNEDSVALCIGIA